MAHVGEPGPTRAARYLLALYIAEHRESPPISPGRIAEMLDRSPAATTEMLQRLAADGLVAREPYEGATLTDAGRERAGDLHETYVALSWFFRDVLDLDAYEREAMEMAGLVSPAVAERLARLLFEDLEADAEPPFDDLGISPRRAE
ncbi:iron-dependent repressor [Halorubrum saccharovorum DSM 1137]|uniref:Iron-dependent repressor n=1 Tax=Halorubrum saccharovorum DSM 1137 TaxID=1227484 RepID=M0DUX5_9EURY|nr:metal-dependent transcriptional regulator [Halorubrum saccharovorum]ELZ37919.1 iron-dependent repressor [Halorubrum saccharovorum DSM 1137]